MTRRAADLMVDCLVAQGCDRMFCVPGESYLALLDALHGHAGVETVVCRHEGGAGMMAVADAKLTGRPGLVAVSRGPGAANASIAVHVAQQDAVPLVLLIGQVARGDLGRGAFQEVDYGAMFGGMAKLVTEVHHAGQLAEIIARAFTLARSGTPGPVVLALPEDMLLDETDAPVVPARPIARVAPSGADVGAVADLLAKAERPLIIAGAGLKTAAGRAALNRLAVTHGVPVAPTFKSQDVFDNASPLFAGQLGVNIPAAHVELLSDADLILALGTKLGDAPTQGYRLPQAPVPAQPLVHVWPDADLLGRVYHTEIALPCDPAAFCEALAAAEVGEPDGRAAWRDRVGAAGRAIAGFTVRHTSDGLDFGAVVQELAAQAPRGAIVTTDAGNFSSWVHRLWPWDGQAPSLGAAGGAMGLAVPAAVAASLRHPDRCVLGFVGDGGALMTGNELATAVAHGATPKIVISDNGTYGTIRLHQEREFPERVSGTGLKNPDFAAWAESFGARGFRVAAGDDVAATVRAFLDHDGPAVLHALTSAEAISAFTTISTLRARARG